MGVTGEEGETRMEIIRPVLTGKAAVAKGEPDRGDAYNDAEMGEGMPFEDPVIELAARKNSKWKFISVIFLIFLVIAGVILVVVLTGSNNSSTNEVSFTFESGWRIEVEAQVEGFDEDHTLTQVEDQVRPTKEVLEDELNLDAEETLVIEVEEISGGLYKIVYKIISAVDGNTEMYKTIIQENVDSIEQRILDAIFGTTTDDQTISIDDTDEGLEIVELTASPTLAPTPSPTEEPTAMPTADPTTRVPTRFPTPSPSSLPTQGPTSVGPVTHTIYWAASLCCLLEAEIDSTVDSIASVLTLDTDRIDVASYNTARRRSEPESASSWNINYRIYTYTTDDANLHTEIIGNLGDDDVLNNIANHITSNTDATISALDTVSLSIADNDGGLGFFAILIYILYVAGGGILLALCCVCYCKCRRNKK